MKIRFYIFLTLIFFSFNLLAAPSDQNTTQGVYVYRPSAFTSWARTIIISVNGLAKTELTNCTFAKFNLPSGTYRFDAALKPWPFDRSTGATSITVSISAERPTYIGYLYSNELSAPTVSETFISYTYPDISEGRYPHFFGVAYPEVATKEMVSCSEVKSLP